MTKFDLGQLRETSLDVCQRAIALLLSPDVRQPVLDAIGHAIGARFPDDRVIRLDVADLLADRVGLAKATTSQLLLHGQAVADLRGAAPPGKFLAQWLRESTTISPKGADTVAVAMLLGDFDAAATLSARAFRDPSGHEDTVHARGQDPLREADARILLDVISKNRPDEPTWILLDRLEEALLSDSPKCRGFVSGLEQIVDGMLPEAPMVLVTTCWGGAINEVRQLDRALLNSQMVLEPSDDRFGGRPDLDDFRRELGALFGLRLSAGRFEDVSTGFGERGALALIWPTHQEDPARYATRVAADLAHSLVGGPLVVVVPEWAMGPSLTNARSALQNTFQNLSFVSVSAIEASHVTAARTVGSSEVTEQLKQKIDALFRVPDDQEPT